MKKLLKISLVLTFLSAVLVSCNDDESYSLDKYWISYGVIDGDANNYSIVLDNGSRLFISANLVPGWKVGDGQRVIANYTILGDAPASGITDEKGYYVRLNMLYDVLSKDVVKQSFIDQDKEKREDSIGHDKIDVSDAWFGGGFLNIRFELLYNNSGVRHFINLVENDVVLTPFEDAPAEENVTVLTLRHNAYNDAPVYRGYGYVSFNLLPLVPDGATELPIKLVWTGYDGKEHSDTGTFKIKGNAPAPESALRLDKIATSVE